MRFLKLRRARVVEAEPGGLGDLGRIGMELGVLRRFDEEVMDPLEDERAVVGSPVDVLRDAAAGARP